MNLTIYPSKAKGKINIPASKSFLHRAIICASLAEGTSTIKNINMCQDVKNTIDILREIVPIRIGDDSIEIDGGIDNINKTRFTIHESASTLRLLLPLLLYLSKKPIEVVLDKTLSNRNPLSGFEGYIKNISKTEESEKTTTYIMSGFDIKKEYYVSNEISSQYASGLLLLATKLNQKTRIIIDNNKKSYNYVLLTTNVLKMFGIDVKTENAKTFVIDNQKPIATNVYAPHDESFKIVIDLMNYLGSDVVLCANKNKQNATPDAELISEIIQKNTEISEIDISNNPDAFLPLISICTKASKPVKFIGINRLRNKESNRVESAIKILEQTEVEYKLSLDEDYIVINPFLFSGGTFSSFNDHRVAFLLTILATTASKPTKIIGFDCVSKSNPRFLDQIKDLGLRTKTQKSTKTLTYIFNKKHTTVYFDDKIQTKLINKGFLGKSVLIFDCNIPKKVTNVLLDAVPNSVPYYLKTKKENIKTLSETKRFVSFLLDNYISKNDRLVAVGGGAVLDFAGFVASIYKRGIDLVFVPTTLLAQVDACVGGKTAINVGDVKNPIGSFYSPSKVFVISSFLSSLPKKEIKNGLAELIKIAALTDVSLFYDILDAKDYKNLPDWIFKAIEHKISFVKKDPFDLNERKALNFGHTIGHAIELKYSVSHGEAVASGMLMESNNKDLVKILNKYGFNKTYNIEELIELIKNDKKQSNNKIKMIELLEIGKYKIVEKDINDLL